jgi:hypothetical protein
VGRIYQIARHHPDFSLKKQEESTSLADYP